MLHIRLLCVNNKVLTYLFTYLMLVQFSDPVFRYFIEGSGRGLIPTVKME